MTKRFLLSQRVIMCIYHGQEHSMSGPGFSCRGSGEGWLCELEGPNCLRRIACQSALLHFPIKEGQFS